MFRVMKASLVVSVLAGLFVSGAVYAERMSYYDFERRLPDAPMLVYYSGGASSLERLGRDTAAASIWLDEGLKESLSEPYDNALSMLYEAEEIPVFMVNVGRQLIEGLAVSPWCLVVESLDVDFLALMEAPEPPGQDELEGLRLAWMIHTPPESRASEAAGTLDAMLTLALETERRAEDDPVKRALDFPLPLAWGDQDELFVIAIGDGVAEAIFEPDPPGPGAEFVELRQRLTGEREPVGLIHAEYDRMFELFRQAAAADGDEQAVEFMDRVLDNMPSFFWASTADGKGLRNFTAMSVADKSLIQPPLNLILEDLAEVPLDAHAFYAFGADYSKSYENYENLFAMPEDTSEAFQSPLKQVESELEIRLKEDLLEAIGEKGILYVPQWGEGRDYPDLVVLLELNDPDTFSSSLDKIGDWFQKQTDDEEDISYIKIEHNGLDVALLKFEDEAAPFDPAWTVSGDRFLFSGTPDGLRTALDRMASEKADSILDSEEFLEAFAAVRRDDFAALSYVEAGIKSRVLDILYGLIPPKEELEGTFAEEIGLNPAALPSAANISRHMFASIHVSYLEDEIVISEGYGPFGGSDDILAAGGVCGIMAAMLVPALSRARGEAQKVACVSNLHRLGISLLMYENSTGKKIPQGQTSGEIFRMLEEEGYLHSRETLNCPANPVDEVDFGDPEGVGYYIDPGLPSEDVNPMRAVAADRTPWDLNHGDGVNVLFADSHVRFVRPEDSGPPDKISNPYIEEDTDIYANTGDPERHAWIRWEREPE